MHSQVWIQVLVHATPQVHGRQPGCDRITGQQRHRLQPSLCHMLTWPERRFFPMSCISRAQDNKSA